MDDVFLIEQPAGDVDESHLQVSVDLADGGVHPVHALAIEHAAEGLGLFVDIRDVVLLVEGEFLEFLEVYAGLEGLGQVVQPIHLIYSECKGICKIGSKVILGDGDSVESLRQLADLLFLLENRSVLLGFFDEDWPDILDGDLLHLGPQFLHLHLL